TRLVPLLPQLHDPHLEDELGAHVPLLADELQHPHLRGHVLLRTAQERARAVGPGERGRHVQGVRAPGRQHARGHAADDRVAHAGEEVPADRPGDPDPPPPPPGRPLRARLPGAAVMSDTRNDTSKGTSNVELPAGFEDLAPFSDWALQGERARYAKRVESSMD